jgi:hypothetical protein
MLSGIASLEWKWVKNAGQHLRLLFTGAQNAAAPPLLGARGAPPSA